MLRGFKMLFEFPDLQMETEQNIPHSPKMTVRITSSMALTHKISKCHWMPTKKAV